MLDFESLCQQRQTETQRLLKTQILQRSQMMYCEIAEQILEVLARRSPLANVSSENVHDKTFLVSNQQSMREGKL